jgi:hypothetical protein
MIGIRRSSIATIVTISGRQMDTGIPDRMGNGESPTYWAVERTSIRASPYPPPHQFFKRGGGASAMPRASFDDVSVLDDV